MKKQPRDKKGRFLSWDGTQNKKYTIKDLERAFLDGLASTGGFYAPSKKWEFYKRDKNL